MAKRDIRIVGDPVLRTECDPIKEITPGVRALVEDLLENVNEEGRAGLAANQIGVSLRAFSWNIDGELSAKAACEGIDLDGKKVTLEGEGIVARLIQHEVGHLDGALYIDGLEKSEKKKALRAIRETL